MSAPTTLLWRTDLTIELEDRLSYEQESKIKKQGSLAHLSKGARYLITLWPEDATYLGALSQAVATLHSIIDHDYAVIELTMREVR